MHLKAKILQKRLAVQSAFCFLTRKNNVIKPLPLYPRIEKPDNSLRIGLLSNIQVGFVKLSHRRRKHNIKPQKNSWISSTPSSNSSPAPSACAARPAIRPEASECCLMKDPNTLKAIMRAAFWHRKQELWHAGFTCLVAAAALKEARFQHKRHQEWQPRCRNNGHSSCCEHERLLS